MKFINAIDSWFEKISNGWIFGTPSSKLKLTKNIEIEGTEINDQKYIYEFQDKSGVIAHIDDIDLKFKKFKEINDINYIVSNNDYNAYITCNNINNITITIPNDDNSDFIKGNIITFEQNNVGNIIFIPQQNVILNTNGTPNTVNRYDVVKLLKKSENNWILIK